MRGWLRLHRPLIDGAFAQGGHDAHHATSSYLVLRASMGGCLVNVREKGVS